ncbi:MAG: hypothetical protein ACJ761_06875 [Chloroflexota bacterium]
MSMTVQHLRAPSSAALRRPALTEVAASAASLSAATLVVAFGLLAIGHASGGLRVGDGGHSAIVDALLALAIALLIPVPLALHARFGALRPQLSAAGVALAVDAVAFGAILHTAFAADLLRFDASGILLVAGYAAFASWLWIVGSLGSDAGVLPGGRRMALVGATLVGMPVWLLWVAHRLGD